MTFGKRFCQALGMVALGALLSTAALGQVTSRFAVPGGAATPTKVTPGSTFEMDVRVDAPATPTIGAAFRVVQAVPASPSGFFTISARDFTASIYNDASSGIPDATVLALPSALLNPDNDDNLGRNTVGLAGAVTGFNLFVEKITFSVDAGTPLGNYTIKPTPGGTSKVTDAAFNDYDMALTASFDFVVGQTLTVTKSGTGMGTVTSDVGLIACGAVCSDIYPGSTVTLTAAANAGSTFIGWSGGGCSGNGTCVVTLSAATTVTAQFATAGCFLNISLIGNGTGTVRSDDGAISCSSTCSIFIATPIVRTLTAIPAAGSTFGGWGGACSGTGTCVLSCGSVTATINDMTPPVVTITGFPTNPSNQPNPQFTFASNEPGATFKCQLDGGPQFTCTSPTTVNVGNGNHTFTVTATDTAGNVGVPASYSWTAAGIVVVSEIPTLNEWMLMLLALLVGTAGVFMSRHRKARRTC